MPLLVLKCTSGHGSHLAGASYALVNKSSLEPPPPRPVASRWDRPSSEVTAFARTTECSCDMSCSVRSRSIIDLALPAIVAAFKTRKSAFATCCPLES